jgi:hypothetical protein
MCKNGGGMWPQYGAGLGFESLLQGGKAGIGGSPGAANTAASVAIHRPHFGGQTVDNAHARRLYRLSWRAAAWRDGASAKPLTVCAVNHPAMSYGHVGCLGFGGSGACRRRGRKVPGCLKSESEERETWTAESLRAASSNGEGFGLVRRERGHGRDFGGRRFRSTL